MLFALIGLFIMLAGLFSKLHFNAVIAAAEPVQKTSHNINVKELLILLVFYIVSAIWCGIKFIIRLFNPDFGRKSVEN
jgi:hypothetical protein